MYWKNNIDSVATDFKINVWAYTNAKMFKIKISAYITYFILSLNNLAVRSLKIFYKNSSFELIYLKLSYILVFFILLFYFV